MVQIEGPVTVLSGRYALEEELGRSGTGIVWRATDTLLRRRVTVKLIDPELSDDPAFAESLADQVRRVASLSAPTIARLLDTGEQDEVVFLVREHVEGTSARALLADRGPLPVREAVGIVSRVLDGLATAHDAGVIHLGLELDDVLVSPDGGVRVTDLGIGAALCDSRPDEVPRLLGDKHLPPEQRRGEAVSARTDVYAVASLLFELLAGNPLVVGTSARHVRPEVPAELERIIATALAPDPSERFADARAFAEALQPFVDTPGAAAAVPEDGGLDGLVVPVPGERWVRTWVALPLLIVVAAAALIGAGLWAGRLELGGPLGIRSADDAGDRDRSGATEVRAASVVRPVAVSVLDPFPGDGVENDPNLELALDGDPGTAWRSENYFDGRLNKDGIGLVFDLGQTMHVSGFRLSAPHPGYRFRIAVGDHPESLLDLLGDPRTAARNTMGTLAGSGRYLLVWITSVVDTGDGNRAEVAEFRAVVADA